MAEPIKDGLIDDAQTALNDAFITRAMSVVGPRAIFSWFDGQVGARGYLGFFVALFHTLATIGFGFAIYVCAYVYSKPVEFNSFTECPRLIEFVVITGITLSIYLFFNILAQFIRNMTFQFVNIVGFFFIMHLFMLAFNITGAVWVYSKPGKYYFALATFYDGCKESLVDGIQKYTLAFFIYTALLIVTMIMNLKVWSTQKQAEEDSSNEDLRREHYAVTM